MTGKDNKNWAEIFSAISAIHMNAGATLKMDELALRLADCLSKILIPAGCAVFLIDEKNTNILAEAGFKESSCEINFSADMAALQYFNVHRKSVFADSLKDSPFSGDVSPGQHDTGSLICSPVMADDKIKGLIYLSSSDVKAFNPDSLRLVELFAREVSLAIELSLLHEKIADLNVTDELTGCLNRKKFEEDIETEIPCSERYGRPLSLLMIDIDRFNQNKVFQGIQKGDKILGKIAEVLSYSIRRCDKLYRYGGEEFVVMLPGIDREHALFTAKRLLSVLARQEFEGGQENQPYGKLVFSIGVSCFPADAVFREGLIKIAGAALKEAKQSGGNTAC